MMGMEGRYKFVIRKVNERGVATSIRTTPWVHNLITDAGMNQLGDVAANKDKCGYAQLGVSNTAPVVTNVELGSKVGTAVQNNTNGAPMPTSGVNVPEMFVWKRWTYRFPAGTIHGRNLTEVCTRGSGADQIFSHALLSSGGSPLVITLTVDEVLDVIYELRAYLKNEDVVTQQEINGVMTTITARPHGLQAGDRMWAGMASGLGSNFYPRVTAGNNSDGVHTLADQPLATVMPNAANSGEAATRNPYVAGSFTGLVNFDVALNWGNYPGGIGAVFMTGESGGAWSFGFSPKVAKTNQYVANFKFGVRWARR